MNVGFFGSVTEYLRCMFVNVHNLVVVPTS